MTKYCRKPCWALCGPTKRRSGRHQGIDVSWQLRWRCSDGAFHEQVRGRDINYGWGFDGHERCWEEDDSGCTRQLLLDDFEVGMAGNWVLGVNGSRPTFCHADNPSFEQEPYGCIQNWYDAHRFYALSVGAPYALLHHRHLPRVPYIEQEGEQVLRQVQRCC